MRPTGRPVSRGSTQAMWNTPNGSPSPAGGVAQEHTYNNRATRAKATLACHVAGDQQVYGRPRSATITAGQLQSAAPRGPPGEESPPSGGRNSVVRACVSPPRPFWSVSVPGIRRAARNCTGSGEFRPWLASMRVSPTRAWPGPVRARSVLPATLLYALVPVSSLRGCPGGLVSGEIRRLVGFHAWLANQGLTWTY